MKIAFKNFLMTLKRYKVASLLNVAGFTLAFVAFYVIASQVYYSLTYNRPLKDSDRTYLLQPCWEIMNSGEKIYNTNSPQPASYETLGLCPEAEAGASLKSYPDIMRVWKRINDYHFEKFNLPVYNGNSSVVDLFGFKPVAGDLKKIAEPNTVIISASVASTMGVGVNDAIWFEGGYYHDDGKPSQPQTVVAIYEDFPKNTFLSGYNIIRNDNLVDGQHNGNWNYSFFVRMKKGADPSKFARIWEQQYAKWYLGIIEEYRAKYPDEADYEEGDELRPAKLTALKDMYYNVQEADSDYDAGSRQATAILATIGLIIVVIAFINFVNFFLALIPTRMRAINICKVFGAGQGTLRGNFIFEAVGLVLISMALALYLMIALQGSFISNYVSCSLALSDNLPVIAIIAVMMSSFAVVAAVYPAFYITRFNASMAVKSGFAASAAGRRLRSVMVGMQFTVAMVLIIVTAVFFMQYRYMVKYDMGFSRNNIATFRVGSGLAAKSETLIERLTQYPDVQDVLHVLQVGAGVAPPDREVELAAGVPPESEGGGGRRGDGCRPSGTRQPHAQSVYQNRIEDHVDRGRCQEDDHGPLRRPLGPDDPGDRPVQDDDGPRQHLGVDVLAALLGDVLRAHHGQGRVHREEYDWGGDHSDDDGQDDRLSD